MKKLLLICFLSIYYGSGTVPGTVILPDGVGGRATILNKVKELEKNDTCIEFFGST